MHPQNSVDRLNGDRLAGLVLNEKMHARNDALRAAKAGAGVGTTAMSLRPVFTSSTVAKLPSTQRPNSTGAMALLAFSGVASAYFA